MIKCGDCESPATCSHGYFVFCDECCDHSRGSCVPIQEARKTFKTLKTLKANCGNCLYLRMDLRGADSRGEVYDLVPACARNPPSCNAAGFAVWPQVEREHWCGGYQPNEKGGAYEAQVSATCTLLDGSPEGPCDRKKNHKGICASKKHFSARFFEENEEDPAVEEAWKSICTVCKTAVRPGRSLKDGVCPQCEADTAAPSVCKQCGKEDCEAAASKVSLVHCAYCWILAEVKDLGGPHNSWCLKCTEREKNRAGPIEQPVPMLNSDGRVLPCAKWRKNAEGVMVRCGSTEGRYEDIKGKSWWYCNACVPLEQADHSHCKHCHVAIYIGNCCSEVCTREWLISIRKANRAGPIQELTTQRHCCVKLDCEGEDSANVCCCAECVRGRV